MDVRGRGRGERVLRHLAVGDGRSRDCRSGAQRGLMERIGVVVLRPGRETAEVRSHVHFLNGDRQIHPHLREQRARDARGRVAETPRAHPAVHIADEDLLHADPHRHRVHRDAAHGYPGADRQFVPLIGPARQCAVVVRRLQTHVRRTPAIRHSVGQFRDMTAGRGHQFVGAQVRAGQQGHGKHFRLAFAVIVAVPVLGEVVDALLLIVSEST